MKKFLSLVLALVMTMSLVTVSAGAKDFTDNSKITYDEAVAVISEIGVVDGYKDGAFNPQNTLTRGAAAKIICNLVLGPTTASALSADAAPFKDVPAGHEFAGYIAYCAQQGIINGYADGTFRPAGTLNGYAFMKMLLGALGYDGEIEGFTGANWTINVAKLALGIKLNAGLSDEFNGNNAVTREEACLFAFNTLQATMVQYDSKITANVNGAEVTIGNSKATNVKQDGYSNVYAGKSATLEFSERYFDKLTQTKNDTDAFGRPAVEWKFKANVIGSYPDRSDLIGSWTAKAPKSEMFSLIGSSIVDDLAGDGLKGRASDGYVLKFFVDGEEVSVLNYGNSALKDQKANFFEKNNTAAAGIKAAVNRGDSVGMSGNGVLTELFMDDDNNVTIVMINTYLVKATSDYNSTKETVNVETIITDEADLTLPAGMDTSIDQDDFDVSGVKEDDYLLVTWSVDDDAYQSVEPATLKTGTVSQYTERDNVVLDGETLKYARLVGTTEQEEQFSINSEAALVLDAYGYILYVDDANSTSSYVFVNSIEGKTNLNKDAVGDAYFTDGTSAEISIKKLYTKSGADYDSGKTIIANGQSGWYTFTKDGNNNYTLTAVKSFAGTTKRYEDSASYDQVPGSTTPVVLSSRVNFLANSVKGDDSNIAPKANSKTIFMTLNSDDELDVYTGVSNAPDVTLSKGSTADAAVITYVMDTNGYAKYVFIDVSKDAGAVIDGANNIADYMMVLWDNGKRTFVEGDEYRQYKVIIDGKEETRYIAESLVSGDARATGNVFYDIKTNSKDYITDATKIFKNTSLNGGSGTKGAHVIQSFTDKAITQKSGSITIDNAAYLVDSNTEVYLSVQANALKKNKGNDYEAYVKTTIGTIAGLCTNYDVTGTAYVVLDDDFGKTDRADYLFVYLTGAVKSDDTTASTPDLTAAAANKTAYAAGEDAEQLKVTVGAMKNKYALTYVVKDESGTEVVASTNVPANGEITFYPTANGAAGKAAEAKYTVTVTNTHPNDGTNKAESSITIDVTVGAKAISSIDATTTQGSTVSGDALDKSKITVIATYTNGDTAILKEDEYTTSTDTLLYKDSANGTYTVTVTAGGKTDTFTVTVTGRALNVTVPTAVNMKAEQVLSLPITVKDGTTVTSVSGATPAEGSNDTSHTAAAGDVTAELNADKDGLTLTVTLSAEDAAKAAADGDKYEFTLTCAKEDGTSDTSTKITVTIVAP